MHDDSPRRDDELAEIRARLISLEQRLASMEQWVALPPTYPAQPSEPPAPPPPVPLPPVPPPVQAEQVQPLPPPPLEAEPVELTKSDEPPPPLPPPPPLTPPRRRIHQPEPNDVDSPLDFEAVIGQNFASWAGGIVLLLGICFFLKYAWDRGWIRPSPQVRVILAVLLGAIVCVLGEWSWRKRMRGLAATLHGTGVAILMTTFFGANRYFDPPVMSRGGAFLGVALSAAVGIFFALRVDVMTVAILSLLGAYISPAILSSGVDKSLELLSYLGVLAAVAWMLSFVKGARSKSGGPANDESRFHWLAVRFVAFAASCLWFFAWWGHFGEENHHHFLAMLWLAFIYCGFLAEAFLTLQIALPRMSMLLETPRFNLYADSFGYPVGPPRADSGLALLTFINTTFVFAALYWVLEDEPRSVLALVALTLAAVQTVVAFFTVSRPLMYSAVVQAVALVTLAVPLWFDDFSITLAWMVLALAVAALGWQLNLPSARGWAVALLFLAAIRLAAMDASSVRMRTVVLTIGEYEITRWLLAAWVIAVEFHLIAWMTPQRGRWPTAEQYLRELDDAKVTLAANHAVARRDSTLDYAAPRAIPSMLPWSASSPSPSHPSGAAPYPIDSPSTFLALIGSAVFAAASAARWEGSALTLLGIIWLTPIVLLEPRARRLAYGPHAVLFIGLLALHWFLAGNLQPLLNAWEHPGRDETPPLLNLAAVNGALLVAAAMTLTNRARLPDRSVQEVCYIAVGALGFAWITFETWRFVDFLANQGVGIDNPAMAKHMAASVLWSLIGFACVLIGFWRHLRGLRQAALWLLGITLAKIFIIDMKDVKAVWRILSFIALGSLLLGVSYLYHQQQARHTRAGAGADRSEGEQT